MWTISKSERNLRGVARYEALIRLCREHGVISPEDPFPELTLGETDYVIAPCFLLYDYSFGPEGYSRQQVLDWASEHEIRCTDEYLLHTTPYESVVTWCAHRLTLTQERLGKIPSAKKIILVNHYPLIRELVHLPSIERFIVWCGTDATKNWHKQYNIEVAVYGHLHTPYTAWVDGVRFEEVSLGYHNQWSIRGDLNDHLRRIWPPPMPPTFKQGSKSVIRRP